MFDNLLKKLKTNTKGDEKTKNKPNEKPIGEVTHFFGGIGVVIIKFNQPVKVGETIYVRGATTDFKQKISSMQYEHEDIEVAKKGLQVGIKVKDKAREGDLVFKAD